MADYSITATAVHIHSSSVRTRNVQFGETVTRGQAVYLKSSDRKYWKADANALDTAQVAGIVIIDNVTNEWGVIAEEGEIDLGTTLSPGRPVILSTTAGGVAPVADWDGYSADVYQCHIGYATAADTLDIRIRVTGASKVTP